MALAQSLPSQYNRRQQARLERWNRRIQLGALTAALLAFTLLVVLPFVWMVLMSMRTTGDILANPYGLPKAVNLQNYVDLLADPQIQFHRYFLNSLYVTFFALAITTALAALGGYGFGRRRYYFRLRGPIFAVLLFSIMLPPQIKYIPQFTMMVQYGLFNSLWSLILLYAATGLPISTYLLSTYFSQLPAELEDAARIDGCSDWGMFWRVMLPLARPALATVVLINFMTFWNELLLAMTMVTDPAKRTLQVAMMNFVGEHGSNYAMAATSLVATMAPVLILYLVLSDKFIEGMTAGALKG